MAANLFDVAPEERRARLVRALEAAANKGTGSQRMLLASLVVALDDELIPSVTLAVTAALKGTEV